MKHKLFWEYEDIAGIKKHQLLHDENFNNKQKVKLEHAIALIILQQPTRSMLNSMNKMSRVTRSFIVYIQQHQNPSANLMFQIFFRHLGAMTDQLGRDLSLGKDCRLVSNLEARERLLDWLDKLLQLTNPTQEQLCSIVRIHVAADYVYFDGLIKNEMHKEAITWLSNKHPELASAHLNGRHQITHPDVRNEGTICDSKKSVIYRTRGRIFRKEEGSENAVLTRQFGLFPFSQEIREPYALPWHRRGMDWYRAGAKYPVNPRVRDGQYAHSRYVCSAIMKDMPLVCSSSSTVVRLLRYAAVFSTLTVEEYWSYALVHMAYNILSGHHTLHEMASVMRLVGIPYQDAHYASIFPEKEEFFILNKQLKTHYPTMFSSDISMALDQEILNKRLFDAFLDIDETTYEPECPHASFISRSSAT